ncbi:MAG: hypothetical protein ABI891_05875 [Acidobacteriota bacterium]
MKTFLTIFFALVLSQVIFGQTKIDEYEKLNSEDESGHLAYISQEFSKVENSKIYILINKEKKMPYGKFLRYFYGIENHLNLFNIPKKSVITVAGDEKDEQLTQIWFVKDNEKPPAFNEISINDGVNLNQSKKVLFDDNCLDCDESPFIKQSIFRKGLDYLAKTLKANPTIDVLIEISKVEYLSKTFKERRTLTNEIISRLKKNQIQRNRISISFISGTEAFFYIIPKANKK